MSNPVPLATWDDDKSSHPDLVWWSRLDKRYLVEVHQTEEYQARLIVWDKRGEGDVILNRAVGLSYGARFGPDVEDVAAWQQMAMEAVDKLEVEGAPHTGS